MQQIRLFIACLFVALNPLAFGETIVLKNGDRITGNIISKDANQLTLETDYIGNIQLMADTIATIEEKQVSSDEPTINTDNLEDRVPELNIADIDPRTGSFLGRWNSKGKIDFSASHTSGNTDNQTLNLKGNLELRSDADRLNFNAAIDYGRTNGTKTASSTSGSAQYDYFFREDLYWLNQLKLEEDEFRDIQLRQETISGIGYQLWDSEALSLAIEGAFDNVRTNYYSAQDETFNAARWALKYQQKIFEDKLTVFHNHELLLSLENSEDLLFHMESGIRMKVWEKISLSLLWDLTSDGDPATNTTATDSVYRLGVGYDF